MDDRGRPAVQEVQALEDLTTPVLQHFHVDLLEPLDVPKVWCGVVWCGVMRCGGVVLWWCGVVLCCGGVVWCGWRNW